MLDLTAIVTCKDRLENLSFCLASIYRACPRPEVVLVDFGNSEPLFYFADNYPNVKVIRVNRNTEIFHKSRAINIGVKSATTRYICVTDADQIFEKNFFGVAFEEVSKSCRNLVLAHTEIMQDHVSHLSPETIMDSYGYLLKVAKENSAVPYGEGCCNALEKKFFSSLGGYDEGYIGYRSEDSDFILRAKRAGAKTIFIHGRTSMIHLPHTRVGRYYFGDYQKANKKRYDTINASGKIIANEGIIWGSL